MPDRLARQLAFIVEIDKLKSILRQNTLADGSRRENDAEHSWHFALMILLLAEHAAEPEIDLLRTLKMALIHDIVEIDAGDVYVYDEAARLAHCAAERDCADRVFALLPADQAADLRAVWDEFELGQSPEARFARALDRLAPLLLNYESGGISWREHNLTAEQVANVNRTAITNGAPGLWPAAEAMIEDAKSRGLLRDGEKKA